jgi:hypothetical protein
MAIVLATFAFTIWNVASRSPVRVLEDARLACRNPRALAVGVTSFIVGALLATAAALVLVPALPKPHDEFGSFELGTLLVALALDLFVGDDIRATLLGRRRI